MNKLFVLFTLILSSLVIQAPAHADYTYKTAYHCVETQGPYGAPVPRVHTVDFLVNAGPSCNIQREVDVSICDAQGAGCVLTRRYQDFMECCHNRFGDYTFGADLGDGRTVQMNLTPMNDHQHLSGSFYQNFGGPSEDYNLECTGTIVP